MSTNWEPIAAAPKDRKFLGFLQEKTSARIEICAWHKTDKVFMPYSCFSHPHVWYDEVKANGVMITHCMRLAESHRLT